MILGAFDPLVQPYYMGSRQPALIDHHQAARFYQRPL